MRGVKIMPNVNLTIYLANGDYVKYLENKEEINKKAREYFKSLLS